VIFLGIGERIKKIRGSLTQDDFAARLGVKQNTVSTWEKRGTMPNEEMIKKLADFGGVTVEWLLRGEPPPAPPRGLQEFAPEDYVVALNPLEIALLTAVVTKVEEVLAARRLKFGPDKKARLIVRVYDDCRAQHQGPTAYQVERALLLVD